MLVQGKCDVCQSDNRSFLIEIKLISYCKDRTYLICKDLKCYMSFLSRFREEAVNDIAKANGPFNEPSAKTEEIRVTVTVDRTSYIPCNKTGVEMKASQTLRLGFIAPAHLDITVMDFDSEKFFQSPLLEAVVSLDASRLGLKDKDIIALSQSEHLRQLRWLSLRGNSEVSRDGVRAICQAVKDGRLDLILLDLVATGYDASPYLDDPSYGDDSYWRVPGNQNDLREEFGYQRWMTHGRPLENECRELVPVRSFFPDRFSVK